MATCSVVVESRCTLGESPTWHAGTLYFLDIKQGAIHCFTPAQSQSSNSANHSYRVLQPNVGEIGAICPIQGDPDHLLACCSADIVKVNLVDGQATAQLASVPQPHPSMRFNDGKASPHGVLVTGFMHADWRQGHCGRLYALARTGTLDDVLNGVQVVLPNGMAWDVAKSVMYFVDSGAGTICAYSCDDQGVPVRNADGVAEAGRVVVHIPKEQGVPDGMTIDRDGRLWVALGEAGAVACYDAATGQQVHRIPLLCNRPTACTFGGADLGTLYVTTREETGPNASQHHGALLAVQVPGVYGAAAAYEAAV